MMTAALMLVSILAVCVGDVVITSSVFLERIPIANPTAGFTCKFSVLEHGSSTAITQSWSVFNTMKLMKEHRSNVSLSSHMRPGKRSPMTIGIKNHAAIDAQMDYSSRHTDVRFIVYELEDVMDVLCVEMLGIEGKLDVIVPFTIHVVLALTSRHDTEFIERYLSLGFTSSSHAISSLFQDKARFAGWMRQNGLPAYLPAIYPDAASVVYPALVKATDIGYGGGITIVHTASELADAIKNEVQTRTYFYQEAISCPTEPAVMFMARHGQLLGAVCTVDKQAKSLFVAGMKDTPNPQFIHCDHLERLFPIMDLLHRIVSTAGFNGNGCINFKYTPHTMTQDELDAYMHDVPTILPGEAVPLYTSFGDRKVLQDGAEYKAVAKVFEINPRVCGPVKSQDVLIDMIRLYMDDFYGQ